MAQSAEQRSVKARVRGSSPLGGAHDPRGCSSAGQSTGLSIRGSRVRAPSVSPWSPSTTTKRPSPNGEGSGLRSQRWRFESSWARARAISSVVRAAASHAVGPGFKSLIAYWCLLPVRHPMGRWQSGNAAVGKTVALCIGGSILTPARIRPSWRSWRARLPPKEQVAGSSPAGDAWSRDRVVRFQSAKLRHAGSIPAEASVTFPAVEVRTRACERGSTDAGYRLNRFEPCMPAGAKPLAIRRPPHIRAHHAQPQIQGGCGSTHAGYRLLSGRSRVRIPSRRPAPRSSAAEHQHRCAPPHAHPPARQ